jgi:MFS family permease
MLPFQKKLTNPFYALLSLPATAMGFGLVVQIAALSWLLSTKYGLNLQEIGLVWATGPLAGILGQVIIGIVSDNVWVWNGRRKIFIWVGGVIAALGLLALPNIGLIQNVLGLEGVLGIAIIVSLSIDLAINVSFNPTRSLIADVTPEGRPRTKGFTWMQTVSGSFGVIGYFIGAVFNNYVLIYFGVFLVLVFSILPPFFVKEPRYLGIASGEEELKKMAPQKNKASFIEIMRTILPLWGFLLYAVYIILTKITPLERIPGYKLEIFAAILTVVAMAYTLSKKEKGISKERDGINGFRKVLAAHSFTWIGVQAMFIYFFSFVRYRIPELSGDLFEPNYLTSFLSSPSDAKGFDQVNNLIGSITNWSFLSLNLVAAIIPVFFLEPLAARFGRVKTHATALLFLTLGYLGLYFSGFSPALIYTFMAIAGIGWAATISLPFAIMSQKIPQTKMGLYMGLFNLSVVLPQFVASFAVGEYLDKTENQASLFLICAGTVAVSALTWYLVKEPADVFTENPVLIEEQ